MGVFGRRSELGGSFPGLRRDAACLGLAEVSDSRGRVYWRRGGY